MCDFDEEELARKVLHYLTNEMGENELTYARVSLIAENIVQMAKRLPLRIE